MVVTIEDRIGKNVQLMLARIILFAMSFKMENA